MSLNHILDQVLLWNQLLYMGDMELEEVCGRLKLLLVMLPRHLCA